MARASGDRCQACGAIAPTRYVDFKQNVGMLVMRRSSSVTGNLCKPCVHKHFWKTTGTTLTVGWLGQISLFIAPIFVVNNVIRYLSVLGMPGPGSAAKKVSAFPVVMTPTATTAIRSGPPPLPSRRAPLADSGPIPFDDGMGAGAAEEAEPVELLPDVDPAEVLKPHWAGMVARIKAKEPLATVAADLAGQTGLTAEQVQAYVVDRVQRAKAAKAVQAETA